MENAYRFVERIKMTKGLVDDPVGEAFNTFRESMIKCTVNEEDAKMVALFNDGSVAYLCDSGTLSFKSDDIMFFLASQGQYTLDQVKDQDQSQKPPLGHSG